MKTAFPLLSRVRSPELGSARRQPTPAQVREAILAHLRQICQTRQGTVLSCSEYGVASLSELVHAFPEAIDLMMRTIKASIQSYEPRLRNVVIRHVPAEDMMLRFDISAQIVLGARSTPVRFETTIDTTRQISIH